MTRRCLFIINPAAGGGRGTAKWAEFERRFLQKAAPAPRQSVKGERGGSLEKIFTTAPGEAKRIAAETADDYDILVAAGGDGTAAEVAHGLLAGGQRRAGLAILPCGTGNDIALSNGIKDLEEAWTAVQRGTPRPMDVIRVECCNCSGAGVHYALSFAGVGIIAPLLRFTTPLAKKLLGQSLAYKFALLRALWSYTPPQMRITCDGKTSDGRFLFLGVSNGENAGGGMRLAPGARIDDGALDVNLVGAVGLLDGLSQIRRLARGRHTTHPQVRFFQSRSIGVEAGTRLEVALDGELVGYSPARFEVQPRALPIYRHP